MDAVSLPVIQIKHKGYVDLNQFFKSIRGWLNAEHFRQFESKHKFSPSSREVEFEANRKINDYVRYKIKVLIRVWDVKDVEIIKNGKKVAMNDCRVAIDFNGEVEFDWMKNKKFDDSPISKAIHDFYHRFIVKRTREAEWIGGLDGKLWQFQRDIKNMLEFEV